MTGSLFLVSMLLFAQQDKAPAAATTPAPAAATASVTAAPAAAASAAAAPSTARNRTKLAGGPQNKMICRQEEQIGSRLGGHRVCMTREQWRLQADESSRDLESFSRRQFGSGQ